MDQEQDLNFLMSMAALILKSNISIDLYHKLISETWHRVSLRENRVKMPILQVATLIKKELKSFRACQTPIIRGVLDKEVRVR